MAEITETIVAPIWPQTADGKPLFNQKSDALAPQLIDIQDQMNTYATQANALRDEVNGFQQTATAQAVVAANSASASADSADLSEEWATSLVEVSGGLKGARGYAEDALTAATAAAADFTATSSTSTLIETGSKTFAIETGKAFVEGQVVRAVSAANEANFMAGQITSASDGSITINVTDIGGSGTFSDWVISIYQISPAELDAKANLSGADFEGRIGESYTLATSTSNVLTIDCSSGNVFEHVLTENTTIAFTNAPASGVAYGISLKIIQDAAGSGFTLTFPSGVSWPNATAPSMTAAADAVDVFVLTTDDGFTSYDAFLAGQNMGVPA